MAGINAGLELSAWARVLTGHGPTMVSDPGSGMGLGAGVGGGVGWAGVVVMVRSTAVGVGAAVVAGSLGRWQPATARATRL